MVNQLTGDNYKLVFYYLKGESSTVSLTLLLGNEERAQTSWRFQRAIGVSGDEARVLFKASETYAAESR
jgi:hypothetical protein